MDGIEEKYYKKQKVRSIAYHESGHTALTYLTKRHFFQVIDHPILRRIGVDGYSPVNFFSQFMYGEMTTDEKIFYTLAGLAVQDILEGQKELKFGKMTIEEHHRELGVKQGDVLYAIKIARKELRNIFEKDCNNEQKYIDFCIQRIRDFISKESRLKKFIARLSYLNQRKKLLLPKHINEAATYAQIDSTERSRLRHAINQLNLLEFPSSSSPLSSAE